jgi:ABC-type Fe3+/spermidine/putrescine transport system ATPase subunit
MLQLKNIAKSFNHTPVLTEIQLKVAPGEIVCLLGPSGCGKTTLLRIVAGLETADRGLVELDGRDLNQIPVHKRNFGLMFQEFALFPHRTVGENIAFGLRMLGQSPVQIEARVTEMLALVNLLGYAKRSIFELSGGERQRVALARSLAPSPRLLMLDEPLGSLDRALREALMNELRAILKQVGVTALYVTHDQQEAFAVADRIVVMRQGRIEQIGTPQQVYRHPANAAVARFLGFENLLPVTPVPGQAGQVETAVGIFTLPALAVSPAIASRDNTLLIRAQAAQSLRLGAAQRSNENALVGKLVTCSFRGNYYRLGVLAGVGEQMQLLSFDLPSWPTMASVGRDEAVNVEGVPLGTQVTILINPRLIDLLPAA